MILSGTVLARVLLGKFGGRPLAFKLALAAVALAAANHLKAPEALAAWLAR